MPLIHVTVTADWAHWFRLSGLEVPPSLDDGLRVDTMQMAADAAIRGLGVTLGRRPLLDDDIDSGRLIPLFDRSIPSGNGYWLVTAQTDFQKPEVKLFKRWMLSEFGREADRSRRVRPHGPRRRPPALAATRSKRRSPRA